MNREVPFCLAAGDRLVTLLWSHITSWSSSDDVTCNYVTLLVTPRVVNKRLAGAIYSRARQARAWPSGPPSRAAPRSALPTHAQQANRNALRGYRLHAFHQSQQTTLWSQCAHVTGRNFILKFRSFKNIRKFCIFSYWWYKYYPWTVNYFILSDYESKRWVYKWLIVLPYLATYQKRHQRQHWALLLYVVINSVSWFEGIRIDGADCSSMLFTKLLFEFCLYCYYLVWLNTI